MDIICLIVLSSLGYHRLYIMYVGQPKKSPRLHMPFTGDRSASGKRSGTQSEDEDLMDAKAVVEDVVSTMQSQLETVAFETLSAVGKPADELLAAAENNQCQIIFIGRVSNVAAICFVFL